MQFSDVIGQQPVKDQLVNMVEQGRVSHAQLFLAKEGTGGLPMALAFAQYMVCDRIQGKVPQAVAAVSLFGDEPVAEETGPLTDACGKCSPCLKAAAMVHPDIHYSYPIFPKKPGDKSKCTDFITEWRSFLKTQPYGNNYDWLQSIKAENKQGNINVYECQDINKKMSLKSFESKYKILIMWMPEMLGNEGNKLLKLIEEPAPNTLFIFVAENGEQILQTILSRTQLVKFPPLETATIASVLEKEQKLPADTARQVALMAEGNYREALHLARHSEDDQESILRNWLNLILTQNLAGQLKWIDNVAKLGRENQKQFFKYFIHVLEQSLRLSIIDEPITGHNDFANRLQKMCDMPQQEAIMNELDNAIYYVERNANPKLLLHALTIKIYHIIKHKVVVEIM